MAQPLDVRLLGPVYDISNISRCLREVSLALSGAGINVNLVDTSNVTPFKATLTQDMLQRLDFLHKSQISDNHVTIHMSWPDKILFVDEKAKANIAWTFCDTDKLDYLGSLILSVDKIDEVWVPSTAIHDAFTGGMNKFGTDKEFYAAKRKIKVVPFGVDTKAFHPVNPAIDQLKNDDNFYFAFIGSLKLNGGFDIALKAFYDEFKNDENVKMILKAFVGNLTEEDEHKKVTELLNRIKGDSKAEVVYIAGNQPEDVMRKIYHTPDCLVAPYRGKAWGSSVIQALAAGVPVITNRNTGNRAYTNGKNARFVNSSAQKINNIEWLLNHPSQQNLSWYELNIEDLKREMRFAVENKAEMQETAVRARQDILAYDWDKVAMKVVEAIKPYGE